jgi:ADP-ribosylglycohydrolase/fructose-1,6-bisphosphatase/inositol monophosphatase family enzyme
VCWLFGVPGHAAEPADETEDLPAATQGRAGACQAQPPEEAPGRRGELLNDYQGALDAAIAAARNAGALLRNGLTQPEEARRLDVQAEQLIRQRLRAVNDWGYRSREAGYLPGADAVHLWLVEPHDGALHSQQGQRGSAVAIAGLRDGAPVLGVVYAFAFPDHEGDLFAWADPWQRIRRNGQPVDAFVLDVPLDGRAVTFDDRLIVYHSPSADGHPHHSARLVAPARYITSPSLAYRLALVAVGEGIAGISLDAPTGTDYAAGHALLRAAGGVLVDQDGAAVRYASDGASACTSCFGGGSLTVPALRRRPWHEPAGPIPADPGPPLVRASRCPPARLSGRMVADPGVLARAQGCLLGQVAGDALGGLVEFEDTETIRTRYPHGCRDLRDGGTWNNLAGQPTDDSELALLLARTLVQEGRYDDRAVLDAYVDWWNDPQTYDRGSTISRALSAAARGRTHEERLRLIAERSNPHSESNGSLMRISPLGVFAAGQPDEAAAWARQNSALTHPNPVCGDSCAVYVAALATAVGTGCGPEGAYEAALRQAGRLGVQPGVRLALERARTAPPEDYSTQQGWVLIALQNAFYQLLHAGSLEEGVVATVMAGGDTDTTAAIAAALLGAVHGRTAIPSRWSRAVRSCRPLPGTPTDHPRAQEFWPVDVLELAEMLVLAGQAAS